MKEFIKNNKEYIVIFCFFLILGFLFPYLADDWFWGSQWGINKLNIFFEDVNGRVLGNIFAIIFTRSRILRALLVGIVMTGIIKIISSFKKCSLNKTLLTLILIMLVSMEIFRETIVWTAGFVNYVVISFFVLLTLYLNKDIFEKKIKYKKYHWLLFLFLGIINSLFMENITIYNLILSFFFIIIDYIKDKKIYKEHISFLVGSIIGTTIMFSNGMYLSILNSKDIYGMRSFRVSNILEKLINVIIPYLLSENIIFVIVLSIICVMLLNKDNKKDKSKLIVRITMILYPCYLLLYKIYNLNELLPAIMMYINMFLSIIYIINFIIFIVKYIEKNERKYILFLIGCVVFSIAPLIIANPITPRCLLPSYLLMVLILILLFNKIDSKKINGLLKIASLCIIVNFIMIYSVIFKEDFMRINYINKHKNDDILYVYFIPKNEYIIYEHLVDYNNQFKAFYGITSEVKIISYDEWKKMNNKN